MGWTVYNSDGQILQSAELSDNVLKLPLTQLRQELQVDRQVLLQLTLPR